MKTRAIIIRRLSTYDCCVPCEHVIKQEWAQRKHSVCVRGCACLRVCIHVCMHLRVYFRVHVCCQRWLCHMCLVCTQMSAYMCVCVWSHWWALTVVVTLNMDVVRPMFICCRKRLAAGRSQWNSRLKMESHQATRGKPLITLCVCVCYYCVYVIFWLVSPFFT